eukprot:UN25833
MIDAINSKGRVCSLVYIPMDTELKCFSLYLDLYQNDILLMHQEYLEKFQTFFELRFLLILKGVL